MHLKKRTKQWIEKELIDTQWDVNTVTYGEIIIAAFELIDTQWDVNLNECIAMLIESEELIDTQWDVNSSFVTNRILNF